MFEELPPAEDFMALIDESPATARGHTVGLRMKQVIRRFPRLWRATRLARRWYHASRGAIPTGNRPCRRTNSLAVRAKFGLNGGPRVLFATSIGSYAHAMTLESALAAALTFRGAEVHVLLCDGAMTACAECEASLYPSIAKFVARTDRAAICAAIASGRPSVSTRSWAEGPSVFRVADRGRSCHGASYRRYRSHRIKSFTLDDMAIGEHAHAGALRFFATGSLEGETAAEPVLRRYLESAPDAYATRRLIRTVGFESAVFTHGIYVPWGIVGEVARHEGVHVSTWNVPTGSADSSSATTTPIHHTLMNEPREHWDDEELTSSRTVTDELSLEPSRRAVRLDRVSQAATAGADESPKSFLWARSARRRSSVC